MPQVRAQSEPKIMGQSEPNQQVSDCLGVCGGKRGGRLVWGAQVSGTLRWPHCPLLALRFYILQVDVDVTHNAPMLPALLGASREATKPAPSGSTQEPPGEGGKDHTHGWGVG